MFKKNKVFIFGMGGLLVVAMLVVTGLSFAPAKSGITPSVHPTVAAVPVQHRDSFTYNGQNGKDALTLLKQHTSVVQNNSGLVTEIAGRRADAGKHEYWAFYVNGKYAQVGPAAYQTKNGDVIVWKIERY